MNKSTIELPNGVRISFKDNSNKNIVDMFMTTIGKMQAQYDREEATHLQIKKKQDYKDQIKKYQERLAKKKALKQAKLS